MPPCRQLTFKPLGHDALENGSILNYGSGGSAAAAAEWLTAISGLVYCNGSTDYIEIYVYMNSSSNIIYNGGDSFSGVLVRGA